MSDAFNCFTKPLLDWFDQYGRKDLPWQHPRTPYRVWISEIMLQQTQVLTVIPYFERFMHSFPDLNALASASEDYVLSHWSGLGYYSRARNIYKTAKILVEQLSGHFPETVNELMALPGIGESTAAAIISQAFNQPAAILDGNVKRVLSRYFMVDGIPEKSIVKKKLWQFAKACMPDSRCADYTQAIMDFGATCCTNKKPACEQCPVSKTCLSYQQNKVDLYPFKKAKKILPIKHEQFLLLYNEKNQIFLEKRPPCGIWGGLWCLPAISETDHAIDHIAVQYGFNGSELTPLITIKHTFSHFHLYIKALALRISCVDNIKIAEQTGKWLSASEINDLGIAKPVNQIIKHYFQLA